MSDAAADSVILIPAHQSVSWGRGGAAAGGGGAGAGAAAARIICRRLLAGVSTASTPARHSARLAFIKSQSPIIGEPAVAAERRAAGRGAGSRTSRPPVRRRRRRCYRPGQRTAGLGRAGLMDRAGRRKRPPLATSVDRPRGRS